MFDLEQEECKGRHRIEVYEFWIGSAANHRLD